MSDLAGIVPDWAAAVAIARRWLGELAETERCASRPQTLYGTDGGAEPRFYFLLVQPRRIGSSSCYSVLRMTGEFRAEGACGE